MSAVTYVGSTKYSYNSTAKSSHTETLDIGTRVDGLLTVEVDIRVKVAVSSVTYGGVSLSRGPFAQETGTPGHQSEIWYLSGATLPNGSNTLTVNFATNVSTFAIFALWADNADPTLANVLNDSNVGTGTSANPTVTLGSIDADGCLLVSTIMSEGNNPPTSDDETVPQTHDFGVFVAALGYVEQVTAASRDMDFNTQNDLYAMAAAAFQPAPTSNERPTVVPNTADATEFNDTTPTLEFTGSDADSDDLRYQIQITDNLLDFASGELLRDNYPYSGTGGLIVHCQPEQPNSSAWTGFLQVDDRPGQSFEGGGGILKSIKIYCGSDTPSTDTDGTAYLRVYAHQGTYGTTGEPLNPADPEDTPTPDWLAISDGIAFTTSDTPGWRTFTFSGANQIRLTQGTKFFWIQEWDANGVTQPPGNCIGVYGDWSQGGDSPLHAGNMYIDGALVDHNGYWSSVSDGTGDFRDADLYFEVYEEFILLDKVSGTDAGFVNTEDGGDSDPFTAGQKISFTVQAGDELASEATYYWRARAIDPSGSNTWSDWTTARSFLVTIVAGPISGVLDAILDNATLAAASTLAISGALDQPLADASLTAPGALAIVGQASPTLADASLSATGALGLAGQAIPTLEDATLAAAGVLPISGQAAPTVDDVTLAATGTLALAGVLDQVSDDATLSAPGALAIAGILAVDLADATLDAQGSQQQVTTGALDVILDNAVLSATGTASIAGALDEALDDAGLNASGAVEIAGILTNNLENAAFSASGVVSISGNLDASLEATTLAAEGVGQEISSGILEATLENATLSAAGTIAISGQAAPTLADATLSSSGKLDLAGVLAVTSADASLSSIGKVAVAGEFAVTLADATLIGIGTAGVIPVNLYLFDLVIRRNLSLGDLSIRRSKDYVANIRREEDF